MTAWEPRPEYWTGTEHTERVSPPTSLPPDVMVAPVLRYRAVGRLHAVRRGRVTAVCGQAGELAVWPRPWAEPLTAEQCHRCPDCVEAVPVVDDDGAP